MEIPMNINIVLIIMVIVLAAAVAGGYKNGFVRTVISLVSLIITCAVVSLIGYGVKSYFEGSIFNVVAMVLLLCLVGIVRHLLNVVFFSAKVISKLPVISYGDKLLGIVFGVLETAVVLWTIYILIMLLDIGVVGQMILDGTRDSGILSWMYEHNYLAYFLEKAFAFFKP